MTQFLFYIVILLNTVHLQLHRGLKGEWDLKTIRHSLQNDSVSCGIHTLVVSYQA